MPDKPLQKVLLIVGTCRSGSTILGQVLGSSTDLCHVGELCYIWTRGLIQNQLCGCGKRFRECEFWQSVFNEAFGGFDQVNLDEVLAAKSLIERTRKLPKLLSGHRTRAERAKIDNYLGNVAALYASISKVSGASVVVDSSKAPAYGYLLETNPGIELRSIHLVRDSRACVFSSKRRKYDPSQPGSIKYLQQSNALSASLEWMCVHSLLLIRALRPKTLVVKYEDFAANTTQVLNRIDSELDVPIQSSSSDSVIINHTVSGNPVRFNPSRTIQPDLEWQTKMPLFDKALVTALTFPLLCYFGRLENPKAKLREEMVPRDAATGLQEAQ